MTNSSVPDPVELLVAAARTDAGPTTAQMRAVMDVLRVWLARRRLDPRDVEEVSSEAIARLVDVAERDALDPSRPPGAWLRVVADHLAIDVLRRTSRSVSVAFDDERYEPAADDEIVTLLDRRSAESDIRQALKDAGDAGEMGVVNVVATWVGLTKANGGEANSREVAARLGVSHTTVQRALRSFAQRLRGL